METIEVTEVGLFSILCFPKHLHNGKLHEDILMYYYVLIVDSEKLFKAFIECLNEL